MKYKILLIISLICLLASIILSFIPPEKACGGTETSCYIVNTSPYAETIGVKNCYFGLAMFSFLSILLIFQIFKFNKNLKKIIILGLITGSIFALYFIYIQLFLIKACCKYCMVVDIGTLISLGLILFWKEK